MKSIIVAIDDLTPDALAKLKATMETQPPDKQRSVLIVHSGLAIDPGSDATTSEPTNGKNTPNGGPLRIQKEAIEQEAVLIEMAQDDREEPLSGCCMRLMEVMAEQIAEDENELELLRDRQATLEPQRGKGKSAEQALVESELARIEKLIQIHELSITNLQESRVRLRARLELKRPPVAPEKAPGQSLKFDSIEICLS
jgi:hypothetical protein